MLALYCRTDSVLLLSIDKLVWESVDPGGMDLPPARGYHSLTAVGNLVVLFGGKNSNGILRKSLRSVFLLLHHCTFFWVFFWVFLFGVYWIIIIYIQMHANTREIPHFRCFIPAIPLNSLPYP